MHPFLEETYLHFGIMRRSMRQFGEAEAYFRKAEELQKSMYGEDHPGLVYTLKQLGVCHLGLNLPQDAQKTLNEAKDLLLNMQSEDDDEVTKMRDNEELSVIFAQLYLAYLILKQLPQAAECVQKSIKYVALKSGARSTRLCSKYYQLATTYQLNNQFTEAMDAIKMAIDIHNNPTEKHPEEFAKIQDKMTPEQKATLDYNVVMY